MYILRNIQTEELHLTSPPPPPPNPYMYMVPWLSGPA